MSKGSVKNNVVLIYLVFLRWDNKYSTETDKRLVFYNSRHEIFTYVILKHLLVAFSEKPISTQTFQIYVDIKSCHHLIYCV